MNGKTSDSIKGEKNLVFSVILYSLYMRIDLDNKLTHKFIKKVL